MPNGEVEPNKLKEKWRGDPDCVELVWENGHIITQGQSSKARKVSSSNNFQTLAPKAHDSKIANGAKATNSNTTETILPDFPFSVPSCGMGFDDMAPWLSYAVEDSDFLRELSGVAINDPPNLSALSNMASLKHGTTSKAPSSAEKHIEGGSNEVPQFSLTSGVSSITGTKTSSSHHVKSRDSMISQSAPYDFTSLRLQKLDAGKSSTTSGFTNFSYFSHPAAITRTNNLTANESNRLLEGDDNRCTLSSRARTNSTVLNFSGGYPQNEIVSCCQSLQAPGNVNLESLPAKLSEELCCSDQAVCQEDVTMKMVGEGNKKTLLTTSSVCSGNSVERASNEPVQDLKRKFREAVESDTPSDEAEEESVGARKGGPTGTSAKRSRAAEVHNLSERRRRDRINEKMRALQELIPNCNKVDKASMLDEAIEYLKTLQLQVQMLSMGAGLYMQPMIVPPGMQPIHGAQLPHFSPMGVGMSMGMGLGMNLLNTNSNMKLMPFQGAQYSVTGNGPAFQLMRGSSLQTFGQHGQGIPMPLPQVPVLSMPGVPPLQAPMAANISNTAGLAPSRSSKDVSTQSVPGNSANCVVTNEGIEKPPRDQAQAVNSASVSATKETGTTSK